MGHSKAGPYEPKRLACKPAATRRGAAAAVLTGLFDGSVESGATMAQENVNAEAMGYALAAEFTPDPTESILFGLARAVEMRDKQAAGHCERIAFTAVAMGLALGLDRSRILALHRGGHLHDLGKVGMPDSILFKPGKLTAEEWKIMRSHPARGEEICRPLASLAPVLPIIRHHHERWDGSGYPDGLSGDQIPYLARIVQVADIYDALVNPRPYKPGYEPKQALRILREETDRGWRDPEIVDVFFRVHEKVISHVDDYTGGMDRSLDSLRMALAAVEDAPC